MKKTKNLIIDKETLSYINMICHEDYISEKSEGTAFDEEVVFDDGNRMAIQVCYAYQEPCWTQGVLFSPEGQELGCTDVLDSFSGEYSVEFNDIVYNVIV